MKETLIAIYIFFQATVLYCQAIISDKQYTTHNGLPQIQVMDLYQDSRGYIWILTKKGVAKFNGQEFTSVNLPTVSGFYNHMYEDEKGILYFFNSGDPVFVVKYNGTVIAKQELYHANDSRKYLSKIMGGHLYSINKSDTLYVQRLDQLDTTNKIVLSNEIFYLCKIQDKLYGIDNSKTKLIDVIRDSLVKEAKPGYKFLYQNHVVGDEKIIEYTLIDGIQKTLVYGASLSKPELEFDSAILNNSLKQKIKGSGNYYLKSNDTILKIENGTITQRYTTANNTRNLCLKDKDHNLWISHENGLEFYSKTPIIKYDKSLVSDVWTFVGAKGKQYFSSYYDGIYEIDLADNSKRKLFPPASRNTYYYGPCKDNNDNLYFSGHNKLLHYDGVNFKAYDVSEKGGPNLINFYDHNNSRLVVGGKQKVGILSSENQDNIKYFLPEHDSILERYVLTIHQKSEDSYWVGTGKDLVEFSLRDTTYRSFNHLFGSENPGAIVMEVDDSGGIWIGNKEGLWYTKSDAQNLTKVGNEAFEGQHVMALLALPNDIMAVGTTNGFSILSLNDFYKDGSLVLQNFNHNNGFMGEEVAQSGFYLDGETLYIPSSTYLSSVNINDLNFEVDYSSIAITSVNDLPIDWSSDKLIELESEENSIKISYEAIGFNREHKTKYSYKLQGHDKDWSPWTTNTSAYYNSLGSGTYNFAVRKQRNSYGSSQEMIHRNLKIKFDVPFHQEPNLYKYLLIFLVALTLLSLLLYFRFWRSKRLSKAQEQQIKYLEVKSLQTQLNPHFIFNVLGTIQSLILNNKTEDANKHLISFSKLIRRYLDASVNSNISKDNINQSNSISLAEEIELLTLYINFELLQYENRFNYEINTNEIDLINMEIPPMIIQPFVENAIKHGLLHKKEKGSLIVNFSETSKAIVCTIDDDGIGLAKAKKMREQSTNLYKSRGTQLVRQRIDILNSLDKTISISTREKSLPQTGTVVVITILKEDML